MQPHRPTGAPGRPTAPSRPNRETTPSTKAFFLTRRSVPRRHDHILPPLHVSRLYRSSLNTTFFATVLLAPRPPARRVRDGPRSQRHHARTSVPLFSVRGMGTKLHRRTVYVRGDYRVLHPQLDLLPQRHRVLLYYRARHGGTAVRARHCPLSEEILQEKRVDDRIHRDPRRGPVPLSLARRRIRLHCRAINRSPHVIRPETSRDPHVHHLSGTACMNSNSYYSSNIRFLHSNSYPHPHSLSLRRPSSFLRSH